MRFFFNKSTSICCGISCIRVIEVWCSIGRRIVANCEVDGTLEEKRTEIQRSCQFLMEGFSRSVELTPILCPLSLTRAKFLDGTDLTWPVARSRRGTLADPRNLTGEKQHFFLLSHSLFYEVMRTWKILKSCHNTKLPVYLQFILPFTHQSLQPNVPRVNNCQHKLKSPQSPLWPVIWFRRAKPRQTHDQSLNYKTHTNAMCTSSATSQKGHNAGRHPSANKPCLLRQTKAPCEPVYSQHCQQATGQRHHPWCQTNGLPFVGAQIRMI